MVTVSDTVWLPLAATLTAANVADNTEALVLLTDLPDEILAILGDQHYTDPTLADLAARSSRLLITTKRGAYPHTDDGVEVRRIFHQLRSHAIENFNSQFKSIFNCLGPGAYTRAARHHPLRAWRRPPLSTDPLAPPAHGAQPPRRREILRPCRVTQAHACPLRYDQASVRHGAAGDWIA